MSEEPLSSDSASETPKKPRRVSTPRPRKTAKKAAAEKPVESAPAPEVPAPDQAPAEAKAPRQPQRAVVPRDPRLDDISGHEGPPSPPPQRQGRVTSNVRDARSEESRGGDEQPPAQERQAPVRRERHIREEDDSASRANWPEPETIQGGDNPPSSGKRKRRRKKKGGQGGQSGTGAYPSEAPQSGGRQQQPQPSAEVPSESPRPAQPSGPRVQLDTDEVAKKAWRIFLGEVGEEGLALIGDSDARELSRRSFRLAEIFLEEQARRGR